MEKVGFLFAGQGSQYVGMGKDLYETFPESKLVFDKANKALGFSLSGLCFADSPEMLKLTIMSQPAILTTSIAAFEAFKARINVQPTFVAGLSLGEYSALVVSGVLQFEDAVRLVRKRAELMNEATLKHPGKMAAIIGIDKETVGQICLASGGVFIANLNCPGQTVISGEKEAVDKAKDFALQKGAKMAVDLEVSGAFHSSLMWEAAMEFKNFIEQRVPFCEPKIPVVSNVDARPKYKIVQIMENLVTQIYKPVLWEDSMRFILSQGITKFYEFGPGKVLKGLMRRIDSSAQVISIEKKEDILALQ
ncbi:MAG: ACP S-malonyltransferase [Candidatus Omnitrophota bacterium]